MRRVTAAGVVGLALLGLSPASATAAPKVQVADSVVVAHFFRITAMDCRSGTGYTAHLEIEILQDGRTVDRHPFVQPDASGTTELLYQAPQEPGVYQVRVRCIHTFSNGVQGVWYDETEDLTVERDLAAEYKFQMDIDRQRRRDSPNPIAVFLGWFVGLDYGEERTSVSHGSELFISYDIKGPAPLGKQEGRLPANPDGETTKRIKIKRSHEPGNYRVVSSLIESAGAGDTVVAQATGKFKLRPWD